MSTGGTDSLVPFAATNWPQRTWPHASAMHPTLLLSIESPGVRFDAPCNVDHTLWCLGVAGVVVEERGGYNRGW